MGSRLILIALGTRDTAEAFFSLDLRLRIFALMNLENSQPGIDSMTFWLDETGVASNQLVSMLSV